MFCWKCGKQIEEEYAFCVFCGASQEKSNSTVSDSREVERNPENKQDQSENKNSAEKASQQGIGSKSESSEKFPEINADHKVSFDDSKTKSSSEYYSSRSSTWSSTPAVEQTKSKKSRSKLIGVGILFILFLAVIGVVGPVIWPTGNNVSSDVSEPEWDTENDETDEDGGGEYVTIPLDEETFPDLSLRKFMQEYYDLDDDGSLDNGEAEQITQLGMAEYFDEGEAGAEQPDLPAAENFKGLELLPNLQALVISDASNCESISLDGMSSLITFKVSKDAVDDDLGLEKLDISGASHLRSLILHYVNIESLDLSGSTELTDFSYTTSSYSDDLVRTLDFSNTSIERIHIEGNGLDCLDLSSNDRMQSLTFEGDVSEIILPESSSLTYLDIDSSVIQSLDLKNNTQLQYIDLHGSTLLSSLNLSGQNELMAVDATSTSINYLDATDVNYNCSFWVPEGAEVDNATGTVREGEEASSSWKEDQYESYGVDVYVYW